MKNKILSSVIAAILTISNVIPALASGSQSISGSATDPVHTADTEFTGKDNYKTYNITNEYRAEIDQAYKDFLGKNRRPIPRTVMGFDERQTVAKPSNSIALVMVRFPGSDVNYGTAFLVGKNQYFATAAHMLFDRSEGTTPLWIAVYPGYSSGHSPLGVYTASATIVHPTFKNGATAVISNDHDYGLIKLDRPIPNTAPMPLSVCSNIKLSYWNKLTGLTIQGYPGEAIYFGAQAVGSGLFHALTSQRIFHRVDTSAGQSGSPITINGSVVGIHTMGILQSLYYGEYNFGVRITNEVKNQINRWMNGG